MGRSWRVARPQLNTVSKCNWISCQLDVHKSACESLGPVVGAITGTLKPQISSRSALAWAEV